MTSEQQRQLEVLLEDNLSGSSELLDKLNDWFLQNCMDSLPDTDTIEKLSDHFQEFETITRYLKSIREFISSHASHSFINFCNNYRDSKHSEYDALITNAVSVIKSYSRFVTISNSSQVYYTLLKYFEMNKNLEVTVCESRPMFEGRILAEKFADHGIKTNLITEAMMTGFVEHSDCVLIGADKILKNGTVINKVGSRLLAVTAKHYNKPLIVLADRSKFSNDNAFNIKKYPRFEICDCPNNIKVSNYYFETIDINLLAKVVTN